MVRKIFAEFALILVTLYPLTLLGQTSTDAQDSRPNIVWIVTEDISPFLPAFGDSTIITPNISRLAAQGIRFTNAFSVSGVCAPSRAALITGMYPTSIGANNMRVTGDPRYMPETITSYSVVPPPEVKFYSELLRRAGYYTINNGKTDYQIETPITAWDENYGHGKPEFDNPLWRNRADGKPFFAAINLSVTHESKIWARSDEPLTVDPSVVPLPPMFPDTPTVRRDIARNYSNIKIMDKQVGKILEQLEKDGLMDNTIIFFYSDHGGPFPRYKREVYDTGLHVPLIVRFPDEKKNNTINDELVSFVDFAPTILSLAGIEVPSYIQGQAFLGDQKAPNREYIYAARDRMDDQYDMVRAVRDRRYKYIRNYQPEKPFIQDIAYREQMPLMQELLEFNNQDKLQGVQKLWFRKKKPIEELYDTRKDPYELYNLAEDSAYKDKLKEMRSALHHWERKIKDKGFTPEYQVLNSMWPDQKQPSTKNVQFNHHPEEGTITIACPTKGASIAYKVVSDTNSSINEEEGNTWNVYTGKIPVETGKMVKAVAIRYGYKQSEVGRFKVN